MKVIPDIRTIVNAHIEFLRGPINDPINRHFVCEKTQFSFRC